MNALTSLITLIFDAASNPSNLMLNSVFSSTGAAASAGAAAQREVKKEKRYFDGEK